MPRTGLANQDVPGLWLIDLSLLPCACTVDLGLFFFCFSLAGAAHAKGLQESGGQAGGGVGKDAGVVQFLSVALLKRAPLLLISIVQGRDDFLGSLGLIMQLTKRFTGESREVCLSVSVCGNPPKRLQTGAMATAESLLHFSNKDEIGADMSGQRALSSGVSRGQFTRSWWGEQRKKGGV